MDVIFLLYYHTMDDALYNISFLYRNLAKKWVIISLSHTFVASCDPPCFPQTQVQARIEKTLEPALGLVQPSPLLEALSPFTNLA